MYLKDAKVILRQMLTLLESHPELDDYVCGTVNLYLPLTTLEEAAHLARSLERTKKNYLGGYIQIQRQFHYPRGSESYAGGEISTLIDRGLVCKKIITKKLLPAEPAKPEREVEEVEWDCSEKKSILSGVPTLSSSTEAITVAEETPA